MNSQLKFLDAEWFEIMLKTLCGFIGCIIGATLLAGTNNTTVIDAGEILGFIIAVMAFNRFTA